MNIWIDTAYRKHRDSGHPPSDFPREVAKYMHVRYTEYTQRRYDNGRRN